jgi:hypothetical protein
MKIVRVTYTTKPEYAAANTENIKTVMNDLQRLAHPGIFYHACLNPDGRTFVHTAFFKADEDEKALFDLVSFQRFQAQLKSSGPEAPPRQELLTLAGWSNNIFNL